MAVGLVRSVRLGWAVWWVLDGWVYVADVSCLTRCVAAVALAVSVVVAPSSGPAAPLAVPSPAQELTCDLDGDGFGDLAIGVPGEDLGLRKYSAGVVQVLYGTAGGLTAERNQAWDQDSAGILGGAEYYDEFGSSLGGQRNQSAASSGERYRSSSVVSSASQCKNEFTARLARQLAVRPTYRTAAGAESELRPHPVLVIIWLARFGNFMTGTKV